MQSIDAALFMFAPLMALLSLGVPVAFALITVAAVFGLLFLRNRVHVSDVHVSESPIPLDGRNR